MTTFGTNDPARTLAEVADAKVRLRMRDRAEGSAPSPETAGLLDGGWWPHTRELTLELPTLVDVYAELGVQITRVVYHPSLWLIAPPKLRAAGRLVHLGWLREMDPNLVSLHTSQDGRIELLVVPPETSAEVAERAMAAAVEPRNQTSPTAILLAAGS